MRAAELVVELAHERRVGLEEPGPRRPLVVAEQVDVPELGARRSFGSCRAAPCLIVCRKRRDSAHDER